MSDQETQPGDPAEEETEEIGTGVDFVDPLKRDEDQPGLDPIVTLPPD
jgi:hypothetical protein